MIKGLVIFLRKTINDSSADALEILRALIHLLQPWPNVPEGTNCDFWPRDNGIHASQSKPKLFIPNRIYAARFSVIQVLERKEGTLLLKLWKSPPPALAPNQEVLQQPPLASTERQLFCGPQLNKLRTPRMEKRELKVGNIKTSNSSRRVSPLNNWMSTSGTIYTIEEKISEQVWEFIALGLSWGKIALNYAKDTLFQLTR